ncbi:MULTISPECIES: VOC family protein [Nocardiaceae]|uniref:VOC family protein n=1 Tax=Nocardiaceae TaxID=85025 RepID=UPI0003807404|nr:MULTISPECIES: VOC family protein [Rhodococcus]OZC46168.1 glyoxalase [Rhodococcus sp. RS1C4]OZC53820.1 glyoxalase [Rhodococcus sp. 06-621-2]OZC89220.1 glyoxalase [Rhodococcus sp. 06-418-1B]OZD05400.1 glyoxalase [Rhodococcus sp. 06-156-4C]OZD16512.1 glyoxalase [Rhodococcus sp. 06-156-4a]
MPIAATDFHHVRLTVSDIDVSRKFYDDVFGFDVAFEYDPNADEETKKSLWFLFGGVIYQFPGGLFGLRPVAPDDDNFDADRAGLDHLSFGVDSRQALQDAVDTLDRLGIAHEGIKSGGPGLAILEFRDPDNIALEVSGPAE